MSERIEGVDGGAMYAGGVRIQEEASADLRSTLAWPPAH